MELYNYDQNFSIYQKYNLKRSSGILFSHADGGIRIHYIFKNAVKSMVSESAISFLS